MDRFKALSLVLLGMVIGLGYAVACGSEDNAKGTAGPMLPGVGAAMAQGGCAQYEVRRFSAGTQTNANAGYTIEAGWTPIGAYEWGPWAARCAQ